MVSRVGLRRSVVRLPRELGEQDFIADLQTSDATAQPVHTKQIIYAIGSLFEYLLP